MATLTQLQTKVLNILGDPNRSRWGNSDYPDEIQDLLIDGIRTISELVVKDALANLLKYKIYAMTGSNYIIAPSDVLFPMDIWCIESDGNYGRAWDYTDRKTMQDAKVDESNLSQDASSYRFWSINPPESAVIADDSIDSYALYPTPVSGRSIKLEYLSKPAESSTLNFSNVLQNVVVFYAVANAAAKKSFDLEMAALYEQKWRGLIGDINRRYFNIHGMTSAEVSQVKDVVGGW